MTLNSTAQIIEQAGERAFNQTPTERLLRQLPRHGITPLEDNATLMIRGDHVYGDAVILALKECEPETVLVDGENRCLAAIAGNHNREEYCAAVANRTAALSLPQGAKPRTALQLTGRYDRKLRKRADPIAVSGADRRIAEQALFDASYKGVTDVITKHVWPLPALIVTRWCANRGVTPNQVTLASFVFVLLTFWLFWNGAFGAGLIAAWAMTFLDTVDGKLARVTLTSSKWGDVFDHGIDLIHPPFWWWAWAVGCAAAGTPIGDGGWVLGIILAGYILQRAQEGLFIARFGIEMHIWRPFDSRFREYTARRNPNLVILTLFTLIGEPRIGLILVAIWVGLSFLVHMAQIIEAFRAPQPLSSWLVDD